VPVPPASKLAPISTSSGRPAPPTENGRALDGDGGVVVVSLRPSSVISAASLMRYRSTCTNARAPVLVDQREGRAGDVAFGGTSSPRAPLRERGLAGAERADEANDVAGAQQPAEARAQILHSAADAASTTEAAARAAGRARVTAAHREISWPLPRCRARRA